MSHSQVIKENSIQLVNEFKASQDPSELLASYSAIGGNKSLPEEVRAELYVRILIRANEYIDSHPKPVAPPLLNVPPPDGGIPGEDPAGIQDPISRAQYEKDIAANKSLAESHTQQRKISDLQKSIANYCILFRSRDSGNDDLLNSYITKQTNDLLAIKKVTDLIKKE